MVTTDGKLNFPADFTFKVIGLDDHDFQVAVLTIFRQHFPHFGEGAISTSHSKNGKYLAMSIKVNAISQAQLDATYQDLSAHPLILFAL